MTTKLSNKKKALKWAGISILALILLFSAGSMIFIKNFYDKNFPRYNPTNDSGYLRFRDVTGYQPTPVKFKSGENLLAGYLFGEENSKGLVVIAPGQGEGAVTFLAASLYFVDHGWRVLSYDPTGTYASEGDNMVGLPQARRDLAAALDFIQRDATLKNLPVMLFGHSWGGYGVTSILKDIQDISAVVSISGFNAPVGIMAEDAQRELGVLGELEVPFGWVYQMLRFGKDALVTAVDGINSTHTPVMVIHGTADESVDYHGASIIAQRQAITNPQVVYQTRSAENRNGHNTLFRSTAAARYIQQANQQFQALLDRYEGNIPDPVKADFYAGLDRFQTSELDPELMQEINAFFEKALSSQEK